jgi:hypothetical protein
VSGSVTGDFGKLEALAAKLESVPDAFKGAPSAVEPLFTADVQAAFTNQASPDGRSFRADAPATYRRGTSAVLRRSGRAAATVRGIVASAAIVVSLGVDYLRYQVRAGRDPLPETLPERWSDRLRAEVERAFKEAVQG